MLVEHACAFDQIILSCQVLGLSMRATDRTLEGGGADGNLCLPLSAFSSQRLQNNAVAPEQERGRGDAFTFRCNCGRGKCSACSKNSSDCGPRGHCSRCLHGCPPRVVDLSRPKQDLLARAAFVQNFGVSTRASSQISPNRGPSTVCKFRNFKHARPSLPSAQTNSTC
jgi:hypothetical protein